MAKRKNAIFLLVDTYSFVLRGVFPTRKDAEEALNNTAAYCVIYEVQASAH
jgi:hypothetical protein